jgi:predicted HD superfamily hydrolase involved in NAD metabolism
MAYIADFGPEYMIGNRVTRRRILRRLRSMLSDDRLKHSFGVAEVARSLAMRFNADPKKAFTAGLTHDIARELDYSKILSLARSGGYEPESWQIQKPVLLHGHAGAILLEKWGLNDPAVLAAVEDHVTGRVGMSRLSQIVFAADYLEPGRSFLDSETRGAMLERELDEMNLRVLEAIFRYFHGRQIAKPAQQWYQELAGRRGMSEKIKSHR